MMWRVWIVERGAHNTRIAERSIVSIEVSVFLVSRSRTAGVSEGCRLAPLFGAALVIEFGWLFLISVLRGGNHASPSGRPSPSCSFRPKGLHAHRVAGGHCHYCHPDC